MDITNDVSRRRSPPRSWVGHRFLHAEKPGSRSSASRSGRRASSRISRRCSSASFPSGRSRERLVPSSRPALGAGAVQRGRLCLGQWQRIILFSLDASTVPSGRSRCSADADQNPQLISKVAEGPFIWLIDTGRVRHLRLHVPERSLPRPRLTHRRARQGMERQKGKEEPTTYAFARLRPFVRDPFWCSLDSRHVSTLAANRSGRRRRSSGCGFNWSVWKCLEDASSSDAGLAHKRASLVQLEAQRAMLPLTRCGGMFNESSRPVSGGVPFPGVVAVGVWRRSL